MERGARRERGDRVRGEEEKEREREGDKSRDPKRICRDLFVRWKDLKRTREEGRRVAAKGRGWEKKTARGFLGFGG